ncbi:hypothetical protein N2152v2_008435 [Parachlorella kessleri]
MVRWLGSGSVAREKSGATSYDDLKAIANKTGNPAKEWHAGAPADGAGVTHKLYSPTEVIVESVKRGAEEVTEVAKEACEARAMKNLRKTPSPSSPGDSRMKD